MNETTMGLKDILLAPYTLYFLKYNQSNEKNLTLRLIIQLPFCMYYAGHYSQNCTQHGYFITSPIVYFTSMYFTIRVIYAPL